MRSVFFIIILLLLVGCKNKNNQDAFANKILTDTILCDAAYQNIMLQQKEIYEFEHDSTQIVFQFLDEDSLLKILFTGEKRVAVLGKKLTKGEANKIAEADSSTPREHIFANEAIALVVAKDFALKDISYSALQQYLQQNDAPYNFIFEEQNKGTLKYVLNNMAIAKPSAKLYAKNSLDSLINYVSKDNQAIGFINLAQISDEYSARTKAILNQVNVFLISIVDSTKKVLLTTPFQSDISTHQYPLVRAINFILGNTYNVVSVGFVNFLFKPKAAKVFLKAGLMPIKHPGREFIVNTESLKNN